MTSGSWSSCHHFAVVLVAAVDVVVVIDVMIRRPLESQRAFPPLLMLLSLPLTLQFHQKVLVHRNQTSI